MNDGEGSETAERVGRTHTGEARTKMESDVIHHTRGHDRDDIKVGPSNPMQILDLKGMEEFSASHHIQKSLAESPRCDVSIACWEPKQSSPIHSHPDADEIYYVLEGEGVFLAGTRVQQLGPGGTVFFAAGEAHQVRSLTRMVLYRVQAGADRTPMFFEAWPRA